MSTTKIINVFKKCHHLFVPFLNTVRENHVRIIYSLERKDEIVEVRRDYELEFLMSMKIYV